jgi:fibronectin type 3 domain-containing protein
MNHIIQMSTIRSFALRVTAIDFVRLFFTSSTVLLVILAAFTCPAGAQTAPRLITAISADDEVYVYHAHRIPPGYGYLLNRIVDGTNEALVTDPAWTVTNGSDLEIMLGPITRDLMRSMDVNSPQLLYLRLQGDPDLVSVLSFVYPEFAAAFARVFIDTDPVRDRPATYRFTIVDMNGNPTGDVIEETVRPQAFTPATPAGLRAEFSGNNLLLHWQYPELDFRGPDRMIRFAVLIRQPGSPDFYPATPDLIMRQSGTTTFQSALPYDPSSQAIEVAVEVVDVTGTITARSDALIVEPRDLVVPDPVTTIQAVYQDDGSVVITWPVSPQPEVTGYDLVRIRQADGDSVKLNTTLIPLLENFFTDHTAEPGSTYFYYAYNVTGSGLRSPGGNSSVLVVQDWSAPESPSGLDLAIDTETMDVTLNWQYGEINDRFQSFVLLMRKVHPLADASWSQINTARVTATTFTEPGAAGKFEEGATYRFAVAAANRNATRSDTVFADIRIPMVTPPDPPANLTGLLDDGLRVRLNWSASATGSVIAYNVYRSDLLTDIGLVGSTSNFDRFYIDNPETVDQTYRYVVTAVDSAGNESEPTGQFEILVGRNTPPPPLRNLQAVATGNGVMLMWEAPASPDHQVSYIVLRSNLPNGVYTRLTEQPLTGPEWTDTSGEAGMWYRVHAVNRNGLESQPGRSVQAVVR